MAKKRFPTQFSRCANFVLTFSAIALSAFCLPACSDDVEPKATAETTDYLPSTTDSPTTFTTLRTCVLGDSYPKSADAFLKRISNQTATLDDATVTVVFTDKVARSFDDDAISKLIALYLRGGNVVYVEPTKEGVTQWMTHVKNVYNTMAQKGSLPANYPELATAFYSRFMSETDNADGVPASPFIDGDNHFSRSLSGICLREGRKKTIIFSKGGASHAGTHRTLCRETGSFSGRGRQLHVRL